MAKTQRNGAAVNQVVRQGKKTVRSTVNPKTVRAAAKKARSAPQAAAPRTAQKVQVTLGDLIAAAFDVTGETKAAAKLVSSRAMSMATGTNIVVVA